MLQRKNRSIQIDRQTTQKGKDKNIDRQIKNKFIAFKEYADAHSLHWGFVRDKDNRLYINNTEFVSDMADENWKPIDQIF